MSKADGMNYAPRGKAEPVCSPGEFKFSVIGIDHGHILGMTAGLIDAGGELVAVCDHGSGNLDTFLEMFPSAKVVENEQEILEDQSIQMVASAAVTSQRGPLGLRVQDTGKHYFADKAPFVSREQLEAAKEKVEETGLKWAVCYSERLQNEAAVKAGELIEQGAIGSVLQVIGMGPHRLNAPSRPQWFFRKRDYGGILIDLGSHQIEQFLYYTGAQNARVVHSKTANYHHREFPEFEDFGDATLIGDNGATGYFRVDWFNPDGLNSWGDGRTFILGTDGYIELRKYVDVARDTEGDHLYLVDHSGEQHLSVHGQVGFPFFGQLIRDCLDGTETAMPQRHAFLAAELCIEAQEKAMSIK